ncbi:uncharacterized protein EV420DRAFT_1487295 [Desarmillaria tabescens]|uniref:Uncharacterized protein n=1 Tax=Armillaria tabescens TaxID=1929756 RepID=A0AA39MKF7_ARMTA|nr:uncharacterized protein EV420DRAFT_1487295 [Desarmillaria tabescens]KAK0436969.1 hypothetical protein EV420DRAFT_1487295 [Desarmillaria tabescens]
MPKGPEMDFAVSFLIHCCDNTLKGPILRGVYGDLKRPGSPQSIAKDRAKGQDISLQQKNQEQEIKKPALKQSSLDSFTKRKRLHMTGTATSASAGRGEDENGRVSDSLKSAKIVRLRYNTPIFRGTFSVSKQKNIWPDPRVVPELEYSDGPEAFLNSDTNPFLSPLYLPYSLTGTISDDAEVLLHAYHAWLRAVVKFCGNHWLSVEPTWTVIKWDHSAFDTFGMSSTLDANLRGRTVLCEATYTFLFSSHLKNKCRLKKALSYDHVGICATLQEQINYKNELVAADHAFDIWNEGQGAKFDVFHPRLLQHAQLPGHLCHLIEFDLVNIGEEYQDPMGAVTCFLVLFWTKHHGKNSAQLTSMRIKSVVIKHSKSDWVVGLLNFCGVSLVQTLGNGRYIYYVKYLGHGDLNPAPHYFKLLQDMKYKLMGHICKVVNQVKKDGTWETGYW